MRIDQLLAEAARRLAPCSETPRLDAELLLAHLLGRERVWLYTWGDRELTPEQRSGFDELLAARERGRPIAHLTGQREFWGLMLATSDATLIPRPDTELLVEAALERAPAASGRLLDLGTGSGAVALAFASERRRWEVVGVDVVPAAVELARGNAARLAIDNVRFFHSDWFAALDADERFELIVSNPPYLAADDPHLERGDVRFEPRSALVAAEEGFAALRYLARTARRHLAAGGWLLVEHGMSQGEGVRDAFTAAGFEAVETRPDLAGRPRVTLGRLTPG